MIRLFTRGGRVAPVLRTFSSLLALLVRAIQDTSVLNTFEIDEATEEAGSPTEEEEQSEEEDSVPATEAGDPMSFRQIINRSLYKQPGGVPIEVLEFDKQHSHGELFSFEFVSVI